MIKNATTADMKTLTQCLNKLMLDGYTEDFKASEKGLWLYSMKRHMRLIRSGSSIFTALKAPAILQTIPYYTPLKLPMV